MATEPGPKAIVFNSNSDEEITVKQNVNYPLILSARMSPVSRVSFRETALGSVGKISESIPFAPNQSLCGRTHNMDTSRNSDPSFSGKYVQNSILRLISEAENRADSQQVSKYDEGKNIVSLGRMAVERMVNDEAVTYRDGNTRRQPENYGFFLFRREYVDIKKLYKIDKELGRGASGVVFKCFDERSGLPYACKSIPKPQSMKRADIESMKFEVSALERMQKHPNVIGLKTVYEDSNNVHLVMEFCKGGDLFDLIKERVVFNEAQAARICERIASVLQFAHNDGVMHRDLKPENILIASKRDSTDVRVADFGSAVFFKPGQRFRQLVGSPFYMSPEVVRFNYGPAADMWSLGIILYILLSGRPPFIGQSTKDTFNKILSAGLDLASDVWSNATESAVDLVQGLLNRNEEERLTSSQVLEHPWIRLHCDSRAAERRHKVVRDWLVSTPAVMRRSTPIAIPVTTRRHSEEASDLTEGVAEADTDAHSSESESEEIFDLTMAAEPAHIELQRDRQVTGISIPGTVSSPQMTSLCKVFGKATDLSK